MTESLPSRNQPGRGARRKQQTRQRLMRAALELMAERGRDGVAINEITEAADVGFGSFYNHFESKEAIHSALVEEVLTGFAEALSRISDLLEDPAEILAASLRYTAERARKDPVWGRFLVGSAFTTQSLTTGTGRYAMKDLQRGIDSGRFHSDDAAVTVLAVGGIGLSIISAELELGRTDARGRGAFRKLGLARGDLAERGAAAALRFLGLEAAEADEIARRPLPEIELPSGPLRQTA